MQTWTSGGGSYAVLGPVLTLTVSSTLVPASYYVLISPGLIREAGNAANEHLGIAAASGDGSYTFTIAESTVPSLVSTLPTADSTGQSLGLAALVLEFNEPIQLGPAGKYFTVYEDQPAGSTWRTRIETVTSSSLSLSNSNQRLTVTVPSATFSLAGSTYFVVIDPGAVRDRSTIASTCGGGGTGNCWSQASTSAWSIGTTSTLPSTATINPTNKVVVTWVLGTITGVSSAQFRTAFVTDLVKALGITAADVSITSITINSPSAGKSTVLFELMPSSTSGKSPESLFQDLLGLQADTQSVLYQLPSIGSTDQGAAPTSSSIAPCPDDTSVFPPECPETGGVSKSAVLLAVCIVLGVAGVCYFVVPRLLRRFYDDEATFLRADHVALFMGVFVLFDLITDVLFIGDLATDSSLATEMYVSITFMALSVAVNAVICMKLVLHEMRYDEFLKWSQENTAVIISKGLGLGCVLASQVWLEV